MVVCVCPRLLIIHFHPSHQMCRMGVQIVELEWEQRPPDHLQQTKPQSVKFHLKIQNLAPHFELNATIR